MMKEVLIVAGSAALGEFLAQKFGTTIEAKAVSMKIPPTVAHMAVVGGAAALGFVVLKHVL